MPQAIAATASLALAVKLKKIFEKESKFLTFPTGMGFSYSYLEFMNDPGKTSLSAQEQLNFKADFSRQMNIIPADSPVFVPDASRFLWDEVEQTLVDSVFASSALSAEEERTLAEAIDYLSDDLVDADGQVVPVNSPKVTKYYEYKTLYEVAEQTYLDEKLSVQFAEGADAPLLQAKWESYREKQLRDLMDSAMEDWKTLGFKLQVEHNQSLRNSLELRKYLDLYKQECLNELAISELSDLNGAGIGFLGTFFSPADAFDTTLPWPSITLTKSETEGLVREAPQDLKDTYGVDQGNIDIESISLEYNNVVVIRPWFRPEFFSSGYWKLPDARVVSNGEVPCGGSLPAFVTSMIVARNIKITRKGDTPKVNMVLPVFAKLPIQKLTVFAKPVSRPVLPARVIRPALRPPAGAPAAAVRDHRMPAASRPAAAVRDHRAGAVPVRAVAMRSSFARIAAVAMAAGTAPAAATPQPAPAADAASISKARGFYALTKLRGMTIKTPPRGITLRPRPTGDLRHPAGDSPSETETISPDGVCVLALVCKRIPKSPNPDTTLQW